MLKRTTRPREKKRGRLIVIDGTDGTGKTTQTALLVKRLRQMKRRVTIADFPRYGLPSSYFVEEYLRGRYGGAEAIPPETASLFYALDRFDGKDRLVTALEEGSIIVSNRYVSANMGHQGGKISSPLKRRRFFRWLDWLEYDLLGIPRPDLTIILHVPAAIAQRLVDRKGRREYIRRKRDLHEADLRHLEAAEKTYLLLPKLFRHYHVIECTERGKLLNPEEIHERIWTIVQSVVN